MIINDAHCHFFSPQFFATLGRQRATPEADSRNPARPPSASDICREVNWDDPVSPEALAHRWIAELDAHGVARVALMASLPGDEESVAAAVALSAELKRQGVLINAINERQMRAVTHYDITRADCAHALDALAAALSATSASAHTS